MNLKDTLGQAFTLEAVFAAILMLSAAVFALQVTAITPLTSSTSSQQVQNQQAALADGFLSSQQEQDTLKDAVLYWNPSTISTRKGAWHNKSTTSPGEGYTRRSQFNQSGFPFGQQLSKTFLSKASASNVELVYEPQGADDNSYYLVELGTPSADAVTVERTIILYDSDRLRNEDGTVSNTELGSLNSSRFYAPNLDGPVYNIVTVRVTVWRI